MSDVFFTGPLSRGHKMREATVRGEFQVLLHHCRDYFAFVYDPSRDEEIFAVEDCTTSPLTKITYEVPKRYQTWVSGIFTEDEAYVNLFHSVNGKRVPEVCFKYGDMSFGFVLDNLSFGPNAVKIQEKVSAFKTKVAAKKAQAAAALAAPAAPAAEVAAPAAAPAAEVAAPAAEAVAPAPAAEAAAPAASA